MALSGPCALALVWLLQLASGWSMSDLIYSEKHKTAESLVRDAEATTRRRQQQQQQQRTPRALSVQNASRSIPSRALGTPSSCYLQRRCSNLEMLPELSARTAPLTLADRCQYRHTTLAMAQAACSKTAGCGGVVEDKKLLCQGTTKAYELRSGNICTGAQPRCPVLGCVAHSWIRSRGTACNEQHAHRPLRETSAMTPWEARRQTSMAPRTNIVPRPDATIYRANVAVNMREYFQGHWNVGTYEGMDCAQMRRVGADGDGGKVVCWDAVPAPSEPCFVLSVGVGGAPGAPPDFSFERDLHRRLPHCTMDVYDGTNFGRGPITNAPKYVNFFPQNFQPTTWQKYQGRRVDIFKIDCEGCEFESIAPFIDNVHTEQLLFEIHGGGRHKQVEQLMRSLNKTLGIYYREPNIQFSDGTCIEFALRRRRKANPVQTPASSP